MTENDLIVRQQDLDAVKEVEAQLDRPWTLDAELLIKAHGPAIQVRRMLQKQLDDEAARAAVAPAAE